MNLRRQLARVTRVVAGRSSAGKLVITCAAVGSDLAEGRPAGVYGRNQGWAADVVFDGTEPSPSLLDQARAQLGRNALIIVLGPEEVPAPVEQPDERS